MRGFKFRCRTGFLVAVSSLAIASTAPAALITGIIYETGTGVNANLYSGTVDITGYGSSTLTITVKNTSANGAVTVSSGSTAQMLLTGVGFSSSQDISGASGAIGAGSTALNFGDGATIDNQWAYANSKQIDGFNEFNTGVSHVITTVDHQVGLIQFDGGNDTVDGPAYGMVSKSETQFGSSLAGVQDSIVFTLTFNHIVNDGDISNVWLAFGSPNAIVPEPSTMIAGALLLLPFGLSTLRVLRRNRSE